MDYRLTCGELMQRNISRSSICCRHLVFVSLLPEEYSLNSIAFIANNYEMTDLELLIKEMIDDNSSTNVKWYECVCQLWLLNDDQEIDF